VRWAAEALTGAGRASLVEAGGDLFAAGPGPDCDGWRVAVEDPRGGREPVAVLRLQDLGAATSSTRVRHWQVDGREVHHIVDPSTGEPAESGLLAVTVVGPDPARAEVWSKALFVAGRGRVRQLADERDIAALLVDSERVVGVSRAMRPYVLWQADRGRL
jgi:thiamine biosynthesis lipoprotein